MQRREAEALAALPVSKSLWCQRLACNASWYTEASAQASPSLAAEAKNNPAAVVGQGRVTGESMSHRGLGFQRLSSERVASPVSRVSKDNNTDSVSNQQRDIPDPNEPPRLTLLSVTGEAVPAGRVEIVPLAKRSTRSEAAACRLQSSTILGSPNLPRPPRSPLQTEADLTFLALRIVSQIRNM
ncbi:hypothetical protein EYF80_031044 [Liparis tanakae]|uniref:Uncharacterized protein n=1 Tax=Liparis tanakae TaxID=230148 RepID=A0A4Z2GZ23_9TELE|nr:hypothetical protein EYF80_031044 [Liparis tanakae]